MTKITIEESDDWFVITDEETGVTTQGTTKIEALLMLADALPACEGTDENLLAMARDVFVPDSSVSANEGPPSMKTDRERLYLRSEFSHTLAANGFPNIHVLMKERLQTLAHPISQGLLSLLEGGEKTLVELAESLDLSAEEALSYVQEFATMAIVDIEEEGDDTVIRLSANYVVIEPLAAVPDVDVPEPPTEPAPPGVLEGIEDIAEGRSMSADDLDDVLKDDDCDVEVSDESKAELAEAAQEAGLSDDQEESLEEVRRMISENADAGKPLLRPPLEKDEIEEIDDEELRALAWDLGAIATAYNYATDPTMPDLAREDAGTWIRGKEKIRLEEACSLLKEAYDRLYDRVGDDLESYKESSD